MNKCGKSFLPECEYFTTGGCISPFNCPYKTEHESITTATSTPLNSNVIYTDETYKDKEIARLTAENEKLRAKLVSAVELPTMSEFKIVDLHTNFYQISYAVLYKSNGNLYIYQCFDKDKAEARLAEIKAEAKLKEVGGGE